VGREVLAVALRVLDAVRATTGRPLPVATLDRSVPLANDTGGLDASVSAFCRDIFARGGAVLAGPVGGRFVYRLRRELDLFCKLVPLRVFPELAGASSLRHGPGPAAEILLVRDNAGGVYQGEGAIVPDGRGGRMAEHRFGYAERDIERIVGVGAAAALRRAGGLRVVVKEGGIAPASALWREVSERVAAAAGVAVSFLNIDFAAYELLRNPGGFDVIVAPNMLGDILADLGGLLMGARGNTYSGNFAPSLHAVYQTNHGAAHDLAGRDVVNPVGQVLALAMLLHESFAMTDEASRVERAVRRVWGEGWRTADLAEPGCRTVGTRRFGELIAQAVSGPDGSRA
jgi:3-isopropylmalate dehydrogenase